MKNSRRVATFILFVSLVLSCSDDNDTPDPDATCNLQVTDITGECVNDDCNILITVTDFDTDEEQNFLVGKSTYDFYWAQIEQDDICWEGLK